MSHTSWLSAASWSLECRTCVVVYLRRATAIFVPNVPQMDKKALFMLMRDAFSRPCQQTEPLVDN